MNNLYHIEIEQSFIGCLMLNNKLYDRIADIVKPNYFILPEHGTLYREITKLIERGSTVTPSLLKHLEHDLQNVGGLPYILEISNLVVSSYSAIDYAKEIQTMAMRRELQEVAQDAIKEAETNKDVQSVLDGLERSLYSLRGSEAANDVQTAKEGVLEAVRWIENVRSDEVKPIITGIAGIDRAIMGLYPGRLYVIAGRPGMGKTVLALNLAEYAARQKKTLYFSMEMTRMELSMRLAARHTGIVVQDQFEAKGLSPNQIGRIRECDVPEKLLISDRASLTMPQISMTCRRVKRLGGLDIVIIDYLGLIQGDNRLGVVQRISEITAECKRLAKELGIPVVILSQLNRAVEKQYDKRPSLADLRDSGSIEQDADVVMLLYRDEYYLERDAKKPQQQDRRRGDQKIDAEELLEESRGKAEVIIAKNRQGRSVTVHIGFNGEGQFFHDL